MLVMLAQTMHQIDETATLIQSHGWGLVAIAIIVLLMLTLFTINMVDARNRERRYVQENLEREKDMKERIRTMEDRQFTEISGLVTGYHRAITEQASTCRDLVETMRETLEELTASRRQRELTNACSTPPPKKE
jgi:hypothetical protein